jgi:hypothetical protein
MEVIIVVKCEEYKNIKNILIKNLNMKFNLLFSFFNNSTTLSYNGYSIYIYVQPESYLAVSVDANNKLLDEEEEIIILNKIKEIIVKKYKEKEPDIYYLYNKEGLDRYLPTYEWINGSVEDRINEIKEINSKPNQSYTYLNYCKIYDLEKGVINKSKIYGK